MSAVPVLVWTDFTCPFSYVTEAALGRIADGGSARVRTLAFELHPAPAPLPAAAPGWPAELLALAGEAGVELRSAPPPARTRKAHEAARFAAERGVGPQMRAALYRAAFVEGRDLGRIDVLADVAAGVGLDATEARVVLDVDAFTEAVAAEADSARRAGVVSVPTLVVGEGAGARVLTGAHPLDRLREEIAAAG